MNSLSLSDELKYDKLDSKKKSEEKAWEEWTRSKVVLRHFLDDKEVQLDSPGPKGFFLAGFFFLRASFVFHWAEGGLGSVVIRDVSVNKTYVTGGILTSSICDSSTAGSVGGFGPRGDGYRTDIATRSTSVGEGFGFFESIGYVGGGLFSGW